MTAETLKPFITPNGDFPSVHATKRRPLSTNLIAIALTATFITLAIIMVSVTIWNTIRISELETKAKTLNEVVENMQKRLGLHYLDEINDFEKEYTNALIDDPTSIDDVDSEDDEEDDDDDDDDDNIEDNDDDEDDNGEILSEFNEEDYDEMIKNLQDYDDGDGDDNSNSNSNPSDDDNLYDDFEKYKDSKKKQSSPISREKRAIASASNGLPIYEASLLEKLNKTEGNIPSGELEKTSHTSAQNQQQIKHHRRKPVMRYDWSDWRDRLTQSASSDGVHTPGNNYKRYFVSEKEGEHRYSPLRHHGRNRRRKFPVIKSGDSLISAKSTAGISASFTPAAHFHLDSKKSDRHTVNDFSGDMYIGSPSWFNEIDYEQFFSVDGGILTAKEPGLYYIYAQVCYNNTHDQNGFVIFHNHRPYLQCLNMVPTNMPVKLHTCHTSGLIYLRANETIHLRDFNIDRNVILKDTNNRSFFGIIKI